MGVGLLVLSELYKEQGGKRITKVIKIILWVGPKVYSTQYIRGCLDLFSDEDRETILKALLTLRDPETDQRLPEGKTCVELATETKADARRLKAQLGTRPWHKRLLGRVALSESDDTRYQPPAAKP